MAKNNDKAYNLTNIYCYRFYSTLSSYVHGGKYCDGEPEKPVIGQAVIISKFLYYL